MLTVKVITLDDDLALLSSEINQAVWDDANEMAHYDAAALNTYLKRQDTVFVACHETLDAQPILLGIASARIEIKPYQQERWLYIDEVDVAPITGEEAPAMPS